MLMGKRGESLTGTTYKSNPKIRESNWINFYLFFVFLLVSKCSAASTSFLSRGESRGQDLGKAWRASWAMHVAQHCNTFQKINQCLKGIKCLISINSPTHFARRGIKMRQLLCILTSFWVLCTPESWSKYFFGAVFNLFVPLYITLSRETCYIGYEAIELPV